MTTFVNRVGVVKIGANLIASFEAMNWEHSINLIEEPDLNDTFIPVAAGRESFSATIECKFDPDDSTGQETLTVGATATLLFQPEGGGVGTYEVSAPVIVETVGVDIPNDDGYIKRSLSVRGTAAPTIGTV